MNEPLKRRMIGLLLIILLLLILSLILPQPGELPPADQSVQRVTLDLQASTVQLDAALPITTPVPPVIQAAPPMAAVVQPAADAEPDIEVPPLSEVASPVAAKVIAPPVVTLKTEQQSPPKSLVAVPIKSAPVLRPGASALKWYVQLGAFSDVDNARQLLQKFKVQKYSGILSPADTAKGTRYRVRIGPYATREQAADAQKRMIKTGVTGTTLVEG